MCFSNLFKYFPLSYACIHNHHFRFEPADAFAANLFQCRGDPGTPQHLR